MNVEVVISYKNPKIPFTYSDCVERTCPPVEQKYSVATWSQQRKTQTRVQEEHSQHQGRNMKKLIAILVMTSLFSVSCNKSGAGPSSSEVAEATPAAGDSTDSSGGSDPIDVSNVPALALSFDTDITLVSFTAAQQAKYEQAIEVVKQVVATEEFRTRVLNYTYNGRKTYNNNNGLTNEQIYQSILNAAESLQPSKNNTMDLEVELYYANNTVVGYTNAGTKRIWVNTKFFNQYNANSVAGNLFHEWLHKLGYGHDSASTPGRPYSVPYAIGYIMSDIGKDFL